MGTIQKQVPLTSTECERSPKRAFDLNLRTGDIFGLPFLLSCQTWQRISDTTHFETVPRGHTGASAGRIAAPVGRRD